MNKGALYETLQIDPGSLSIDQLFSIISEFRKELISMQEQINERNTSRKSLGTSEKAPSEVSVQSLIEERDNLLSENKHLNEILEAVEGQLQRLNTKNKELSEVIGKQEQELAQLKLIIKTKSYKNIVNIEILDNKKEEEILKNKLKSAKSKIESLKKREEAYENANLYLRRRMMRYTASSSPQKPFKQDQAQLIKKNLAELSKEKENEEDSVLSTVRSSLDNLYKELLLAFQMSADQVYSMTAENFCQIEKKINMIIMSLHENAEISPDAKHRRRIISHGIRLNTYSSQRNIGKFKSKTPLIFN